jgi:hypothetical protein
MEEIFPFIEQAQQDLKERTQRSQLATDIALRQFLSVLLWFRLVLLQDAALLFAKHPELSMFRFKPFNAQRFRDYAGDAVQAVARAEEQARMAFNNLPEHLVSSLKGLVTSMTLDQQAQRAENEALRAEVRCHMETQSALLTELASGSRGRRSKGHKSAMQAGQSFCLKRTRISTTTHQSSSSSITSAYREYSPHGAKPAIFKLPTASLATPSGTRPLPSTPRH